jgi:hypothetical protein
VSGALKRVVLPRESQAWAKKLDLVRWVRAREWNAEPRLKIITKVREIWTIAGRVDLGDDPESIVRAAYGYFETDEDFATYVLVDCNQDMTAEGDWEAANTAYAWVVLQRYNRDLGGEEDD